MRLKEYEVLYVERAENPAYICRAADDGMVYRVIEASDRERIAKYIKYFAVCRPKAFREDFCLNEKYYAVFSEPDGIPLKVAEEPLTAQKAVRALAMQNPPPEIAVRLLSREHIFVCGGELEFAYDLPETYEKVTREYFFAKLADFIEPLCEDRDRNTERWLSELRGGKFESLPDAYINMPAPADKAALGENGLTKKIKALLPKAAAAIAAAAAITAAYFALGKDVDEPEYEGISSLGTIDLTERREG